MDTDLKFYCCLDFIKILTRDRYNYETLFNSKKDKLFKIFSSTNFLFFLFFIISSFTISEQFACNSNQWRSQLYAKQNGFRFACVNNNLYLTTFWQTQIKSNIVVLFSCLNNHLSYHVCCQDFLFTLRYLILYLFTDLLRKTNLKCATRWAKIYPILVLLRFFVAFVRLKRYKTSLAF